MSRSNVKAGRKAVTCDVWIVVLGTNTGPSEEQSQEEQTC